MVEKRRDWKKNDNGSNALDTLIDGVTDCRQRMMVKIHSLAMNFTGAKSNRQEVGECLGQLHA